MNALDPGDVLRNYGLAIFLILWGTWMITYRVWPWWVEKDRMRMSFEGKRVDLEGRQQAVFAEIASTLGELKQLVAQDRDTALAALSSINEHRRETSSAVVGISELRVEVAKLGRAKVVGGEPPRKGAVKTPPAKVADVGIKVAGAKKKAAESARKVS